MIFFKKSEKSEDDRPDLNQDLRDLQAAIEKAQLPSNVATVAVNELERLEKTDPAAAEYAIGLNYIEYLISLPWEVYTEDNLDLQRAANILESEHYALRHVKERILDYLAVRTLCRLRTHNLLVVDDEEIARTNLAYILQKEGYHVSVAANGLEALKVLEGQEFDLVLTDLKMEKMDGIQLLESVNKPHPTQMWS